MKKILIILDGAADLPNKILKDKTPFEAANTPHLDFLAKNGQLGLMYPLNKKTIPSSANSLVALFGNDPKKCQRGVYEAIGAGFNLKRGDLALRTNFATIDNLKSKKLIDRRAGRTLTTKESNQLAESLNKEISLPCKFEFKSTIQHRGVLVLKGGHSDNISSVNSGWAGNDKANQFKFSEPLDNDPDSKYSSNLINKFIHQSYQILNNHPINKIRIKKGLFPANIILTRGAGSELPKIKPYKSWMSINSMPLEVGIAKLSKIKINENEIDEFSTKLSSILDWVEQLNEVNTDNVEPLSNVSTSQLPLRQDKEIIKNKSDEVLSNAPEKVGDYFVVPKVVE